MPEKTIYLDNAAATPLRAEAYEAMLPHLTETYGNPGSIHHIGRGAAAVLESARRRVARAIGGWADELTFTASGTEANNLAIIGTARAMRKYGNHILVSQIEHKSVLSALETLRNEDFDVEYVPVQKTGRVRVEDVLSRVRDTTTLVSVMYANNEIGTIEPIAEISEALKNQKRDSRPLFHTDACQVGGQLPIDPNALGVDLMTLNSSKMYGPKGVGLLYARKDTPIEPIIHGGEQESGRRAGTENVPAIVGFSVALEHAVTEQEDHARRTTTLRDTFIRDVQSLLPDTLLNGHATERLPNNVHFSFPHIEGESLVLLLDTYGICASTGSACSAHDLTPSHVLRAIGQNNERIHGSVRFTLGRYTTKHDLRETARALRACVTRLESLSPLTLSI